MLAGIFAEKLSDAGQHFDDRLILCHLAVKHAQRIGYGAPLAVAAHLVFDWIERLAQRFVERSAVGRSADRIQLEIPIRDAEPVEQRGQHLQHFRIPRRRLTARGRRPDYLSANLIELAIAAFLRAFAAELRTDVVELVQARS